MKLNGLLKTRTVFLESLGEEAEIRELSYAAQMAIHADPDMAGPITVKFALGLEEPIEEIANLINLQLVAEVQEVLVDMMDLPAEDMEKNSESTQSDASLSH